MHRVRMASVNDFAEWRAAARALLLASVPPDEVIWEEPAAQTDLFAEPDPLVPVPGRAVGTVPEQFVQLAEAAICHSDPGRFGLLYRLLWRLIKDRTIMGIRTDPDIDKLFARVSAVRRDSHKMKAFVRFRDLEDASGEEHFAAWFEPEHYVLERTAPFFMRRFSGMNWAIVTPYRSAFWDGETLSFGEGGNKASLPTEDAMEAVWKTYFASIFNPARLKVAMMQSEMPKKYWRNLPEAELIPQLIRDAKAKEQEMIARMGSEPPARHKRVEARARADAVEEATEIKSLTEARSAVQVCRRCPLYEHATQAVFGDGPEDAEIMFVGEQPGDQEDLAGRPFVGPAGKVFNAAMQRVGLDRTRAYVTNAVKHFKFVPRGKRRIHQNPNTGEIAACRFWLDLELAFVKPQVIVALGGSAAQSLLGKAATISKLRGEPITLDDGRTLFVTVHPSYLLRIPDEERKAAEHKRFEEDLDRVREFLEHRGRLVA